LIPELKFNVSCEYVLLFFIFDFYLSQLICLVSISIISERALKIFTNNYSENTNVNLMHISTVG